MKEHGLPPLKLFTQSHHRSNVFSPKILIYKQRVHPAAVHLRNEFDQKSDLFSNCSQPPIYHFHILYSFQEFCNQGHNCTFYVSCSFFSPITLKLSLSASLRDDQNVAIFNRKSIFHSLRNVTITIGLVFFFFITLF